MTGSKILITSFLLFTLCITVSAQQQSVEKFSYLNGKSIFLEGKIFHLGASNFPVNKMKKTPGGPFFSGIVTPLAGNYYSNGLGFFCRKEWQLEKTTAIPLRFRLGSLAYTNYLEGKPNALPLR